MFTVETLFVNWIHEVKTFECWNHEKENKSPLLIKPKRSKKNTASMSTNYDNCRSIDMNSETTYYE